MTTTKIINGKDALDLLKQAVDLKGADYVDPNSAPGRTCNYSDMTGAPLCIVGHAFDSLGLDLMQIGEGGVDEIIEFEHDPETGERTSEVGYTVASGTIAFTPAALTVFYTAQQYQDNGKTWGTGVEYAEQELRNSEEV